ncbi:hypothetical protein KGS77_23380 [Streptomyces sp. MST-110588]|nr:hypothetical protein KGS77_23380 [Streptomyces sp. MST-110588]
MAATASVPASAQSSQTQTQTQTQPQAPSGIRHQQTDRTDPNGRYTAKEIHRFLVNFYGEHGPTPWKRAHQVAPELQKKAANTPDYDLLLCAQNEPRGISVGKVTTAQSARVGWATVTTRWAAGADRHFTAYVDLDGKQPLKLLDVSCSA